MFIYVHIHFYFVQGADLSCCDGGWKLYKKEGFSANSDKNARWEEVILKVISENARQASIKFALVIFTNIWSAAKHKT